MLLSVSLAERLKSQSTLIWVAAFRVTESGSAISCSPGLCLPTVLLLHPLTLKPAGDYPVGLAGPGPPSAPCSVWDSPSASSGGSIVCSAADSVSNQSDSGSSHSGFEVSGCTCSTAASTGSSAVGTVACT